MNRTERHRGTPRRATCVRKSGLDGLEHAALILRGRRHVRGFRTSIPTVCGGRPLGFGFGSRALAACAGTLSTLIAFPSAPRRERPGPSRITDRWAPRAGIPIPILLVRDCLLVSAVRSHACAGYSAGGFPGWDDPFAAISKALTLPAVGPCPCHRRRSSLASCARRFWKRIARITIRTDPRQGPQPAGRRSAATRSETR